LTINGCLDDAHQVLLPRGFVENTWTHKPLGFSLMLIAYQADRNFYRAAFKKAAENEFVSSHSCRTAMSCILTLVRSHSFSWVSVLSVLAVAIHWIWSMSFRTLIQYLLPTWYDVVRCTAYVVLAGNRISGLSAANIHFPWDDWADA